MDLYAPAARIAAIETALAGAAGATRAQLLVELAWHLRQRDSRRALELADAAARHLEHGPAPQRPLALRWRLAVTRCEIAALFSRIDEAEHWLALAHADAAAADPSGKTDAWLAEAVVAKEHAQRERLFEAYRQAIATSAQGVDSMRHAAACAWLAYAHSFGSPHEPHDPTASADHAAVDALLCAAHGMRLVRREPARAVERLLHASAQAQRVGLVREAVVATLNAGSILAGLGEHDKAAACFDVAESVARRTDWPALLGICRTQMGSFLSVHGRLEDAHQLLVEAHVALATTPSGINRANACHELALVLWRLDRAVEAVEPSGEAVRMYRSAESWDNLAHGLTHHARLLSAAGQPAPAIEAIDQARALIEAHGLPALAIGVNFALADIHRRHRLPVPESIEAPTAALHYGELALRDGARIQGWKASADDLVALADGWAATGDVARAFTRARQAIAAMKLEMTVLKRPSPSLVPLRSAKAAPPLDELGLWHPAFAAPQATARDLLTPKELQVLQLLARSYSNKEIAISLEVSDETVKWHLKKIFGKLEVGSRKQAVTRARALGVVGFDA